MNLTKVYMANIIAFVFSFANIKETLQVTLLVLSVGYTAYKWVQDHRKNKQKTEKAKNDDTTQS